MLSRRALLAAALASFLPTQTRVRTDESLPAPLLTRLVCGGDVMLSRHVSRIARQHNDPAWPFRRIAPYLQQADIAFVNLESPFSDRGPLTEKGLVFKAELPLIDGLKLAGIDVVSTANNHARDQGDRGLRVTLDWLDRHHILAAGTGRTGDFAHLGAILTRNHVRWGFLAYTYDQSNGNHPRNIDQVAMMDVAQMRRDVASLRQRADVAIVSMHAGVEYAAQPNAQQQEFARAAINAGARLVIGHHPHVVQPAEEYGDGLIFYSLGNLVFDQYQTGTRRGYLGEVVFEGRHIREWRTIDVAIEETVPRVVS